MDKDQFLSVVKEMTTDLNEIEYEEDIENEEEFD